MANYLLVPATRFLVPLGTLDPVDAAPLSDAALTSYHAIKRWHHLLGPVDRCSDWCGRTGPDGNPDN
jgi:alcohol dehydrogenase, propanol-preferring